MSDLDVRGELYYLEPTLRDGYARVLSRLILENKGEWIYHTPVGGKNGLAPLFDIFKGALLGFGLTSRVDEAPSTNCHTIVNHNTRAMLEHTLPDIRRDTEIPFAHTLYNLTSAVIGDLSRRGTVSLAGIGLTTDIQRSIRGEIDWTMNMTPEHRWNTILDLRQGAIEAIFLKGELDESQMRRALKTAQFFAAARQAVGL